jgi:hypothetical protein
MLRWGLCYVSQAGSQFLVKSDPPALASCIAGTTGVPRFCNIFKKQIIKTTKKAKQGLEVWLKAIEPLQVWSLEFKPQPH